jgi:hypothetical protein
MDGSELDASAIAREYYAPRKEAERSVASQVETVIAGHPKKLYASDN